MEEQLISFETAKLAKEKGFEELVNNCYYEEKLFGTYAMMDENDLAFIDVMDGNELENHNNLNFINYKCRFSAPTQSLLQKWLREKHKIQMLIQHYTHIKYGELYAGFVYNPNIIYCSSSSPVIRKALTYEEALEVCLQKALKLI